MTLPTIKGKTQFQVQRETLEFAAALIDAKGSRPCDCESCECGNIGDAVGVAQWDEARRNADAIRAKIPSVVEINHG